MLIFHTLFLQMALYLFVDVEVAKDILTVSADNRENIIFKTVINLVNGMHSLGTGSLL